MVEALFVARTSNSTLERLYETTLMTTDDEFEAFFLTNYESVLRVLTLTTGDRERATDATQEAFIKAYARWSTVRRYDSPAGWVRRVAINLSRDSFRSDRRRRRREEVVSVDAAAHDTARHDAGTTAIDLLGKLPTRQREVATLFYVDDRSVEEIAEILKLRSGTVKYHLSHAREGLRRLIDTAGTTP